MKTHFYRHCILKSFLVIPLALIYFESESKMLSPFANNYIVNILKNTNNNIFSPAPVILQNTVPQNNQSEPVFTLVEQQPVFPGGTAELYNFLLKNIRYPEDARKLKTEGSIIVQFLVTKEGKIKNTKIVKSLSPGTDAEAERLISLMPDWTPGKQNGKLVNVLMTLPIRFKLANSSKAKS